MSLTSMSRQEYAELIDEILNPNEKPSREWWHTQEFPYATDLDIDVSSVPLERCFDLARVISGTPDLDVYENVLYLLKMGHAAKAAGHRVVGGTPNFPTSFINDPDRVAAKRIAGRLLDGYVDGSIPRIDYLLTSWRRIGILTEKQSAVLIDMVMEKADEHPWEMIYRVISFPREIAVPWLMKACRDGNPETVAIAIASLVTDFDENPPEDLLRDISGNWIVVGALLSKSNDERVRGLLGLDLTAAVLAKAGMAYKYFLSAVPDWQIGEPELEIEQAGLVDGESVGTYGVIYVFRYRLPHAGHPEWMAGVSGPYSVGEEPARHLSGLDYTYAVSRPIETTIEAELETAFGVSMMFSCLAAKPPSLG